MKESGRSFPNQIWEPYESGRSFSNQIWDLPHVEGFIFILKRTFSTQGR